MTHAEMIELRLAGMTLRQIAARASISHETVRKALSGLSYKAKRLLTATEVAAIVELRRTRHTIQEIADTTRRNTGTVSAVLAREAPETVNGPRVRHPRPETVERNNRVASLQAQGLPNKEIAAQLGLSQQMVMNTLRRIARGKLRSGA